MLPFVFLDPARLGGVQPWGIFIAVGFLVGDALWMRRAKLLGYDLSEFRAFVLWQIAMGFFVGHVLDEIFYHPEQIALRPLSPLFVWEGQSSLGGFVGSLVGGLSWKYLEVRKRGLLRWVGLRATPMALLPFADVGAATFPVAFAFGRAGCAIVHDHPGALASPGALLAVAWPLNPEDGVHHILGPLHVVYGSSCRYDLGLLECLFTIVLAAAMAATWKRRLPVGTYLTVAALAYAPVRFAMDFLRATDGVPGGDLRHGALTFAQYACIAFFAYGCFQLRAILRDQKVATPLPSANPSANA